MANHHLGAAVEKRLRFKRATPFDQSGKYRFALVWIKLRPNRRVNSIGPDQNVAPRRDRTAGTPVGKVRRDAIGILLE
jgi:hypothetical protein